MKDIDEQLNLWANGRLPEAERHALEQKMADDPALAREAEFLKALRSTVQSEPATGPGELGLARLQKAIRAEQEEAPVVLPRRNFWRPVAIAASLIVGIQAALLLGPEPWDDGSAVDMMPASGEEAPRGPRVQMVFDPAATMADVQTAVLSVNGSIVSGPSALGIIQLGLPEEASIEEAVDTLRAYDFVDEVIAP
ncbi:anti-sigma factor family protein [Marinimicrobium koreense]|uniref:anti-sigma factor family protein n=1 Tax=Marinimicrobium koreense TaxID=306545 RepID=UPI003F72479D